MLPITSVSSAVASSGTTASGSVPSPNSKPVDSADRQKLNKAAGDFESILLASMWKSMKEGFKDPKESDSDPASGTIDDWGIEVMSDAVGKSRALGIGNLILKHLGSKVDGQSTAKPAPNANVFGKSADKEL